MELQEATFGQTNDGQSVSLFSITNRSGASLQLTNFGGIITAINVPDRAGLLANVNLGFSQLGPYLIKHPFFGATVGRFCNRIAWGRFELDGTTYHLAQNKGPHHIHGGLVGFDKQVWSAETFCESLRAGVRLHLRSPDGQEGFPGNLDVMAEYAWNSSSELTCRFIARTDKSTVVNLTNHAYFNLSGVGASTIGDHILKLAAQQFLAVDEHLIPTGEFTDVADTPLDFRQLQPIGAKIDQLPATKGYDHCFIIDGPIGSLRSCAWVQHPASGRTMEVLTTQPGVQLYTGNHLTGTHRQHSGFCLETQHYPDSPNKPHFPSTRLDPGQRFEQTTIYKFGTN